MAQTSVKHSNRNCFLCNNQVRHNDKFLHCDCCNRDIHLWCSAFGDHDYDRMCNVFSNMWYCAECIAAVFPFSSIVDDNEFINYLHRPNDNTEEQLMYTVQNADHLKLCSPSLSFDRNFDADRNYLKYNCDNTTYCTESQFNSAHFSKQKLTKFSVLHINARSLF